MMITQFDSRATIEHIRLSYETRSLNAIELASPIHYQYQLDVKAEREQLYTRIIQSLPHKAQEMSLMEIGAGSGSNLFHFNNLGFDWSNLYANELLEHRADGMRMTLPTQNIYHCDALDLPFEKVAYSFHLLSKKRHLEGNIEFVKKVNPEDVENSTLKKDNVPTYIFNNHKYATFPLKVARKITYTESLRVSSDGNTIIGFSRPFIDDITNLDEFDDKTKFIVYDNKQEKHIEVEGYRGSHLQFTKVEKISESQTRITVVMIVDPKFMIQPGKTGLKMVATIFAKQRFKKIDQMLQEVSNDFTFENAKIDEEKEPFVKILQNLFSEKKKESKENIFLIK